MSQEYQCSGPSALALFECQIRDPFGDPLALLTMVFHRFYGARRVLYIVETSLISRIRIPLSLSLSLSAILLKIKKLPGIQGGILLAQVLVIVSE